MSQFSRLARRTLPLVALATAATLSAQSFASHGAVASGTPTTPTRTTAQPAPKLDLAPEKKLNANVHDGTLTIDGMVAKVHMNYTIRDANFLYIYLPDVGVASIALSKVDNCYFVKDAFRSNTLTFQANGHTFQLTSEGPLLQGDGRVADAFIHFDPAARSLDHYPMVGYGNAYNGGYTWPGSARSPRETSAKLIVPPPVPVNLLPRYAPAVTAAVTVR